MATGYYSLSGVSVAGGGTTLTATQIAAPGADPGAVNFLNLVGGAGADGTPAGALILGPAGQVGIVRHANSATQLQLSKAWVGAAISSGTAEIILGINNLPIGRLASLITQIITQRPLLKTNNLSEYLGDTEAQIAAQANLGLAASFLALAGGTLSGTLNFADFSEGVRLAGGGMLFDHSSSGAGGAGRTVLAANNNSFDLITEDQLNFIFSAQYAAAAPTFKGQTMWHDGNVAASRVALGIDEVEVAKSAGNVTGASVILTLPAGYRAFRLLVNYLRPSSSARIYMTTSQDSGSTYPNTTGSYAWRQMYAESGAGVKYDSATGPSSVIELTPLQMTSNSGTASVFDLLIEPGTTAIWPSLKWTGGFYLGGSDDVIPVGAAIGARRAVGRMTNLRMTAQGGVNFTINYKLIGVL